MGLADSLKYSIGGSQGSTNMTNIPVEYAKTISFNKAFRALLSQDKFIARSDYKELVDSYGDVSQVYKTLAEAGMLDDYVAKYALDGSEIVYFRTMFNEIKDLSKESPTIREHNAAYVERHLESEQQYLDDILKACDPAISLDREQREVVLSEEDHTLVIAGAGAGKTTTVAAKVRYLVEKRGIDPTKILVISFTNKAVEELRERINHNLKIPCPIATFHSIGYTILRQGEEDRKKIVEGGYLYSIGGFYQFHFLFLA